MTSMADNHLFAIDGARPGSDSPSPAIQNAIAGTTVEQLQREMQTLRAELALRDSQARHLQDLVDSVDTPIFALDRDYGYVAFNRAHAAVMQALYGVDIQVGRCLADYQAPADWAIAKENLAASLRGKTLRAAAYSGAEGRDRRYYEVVHRPMTSPDGEIMGVSVFADDLTEYKRAEEALQETQTLLKLALDQSQTGVTIAEVPSGRIRYMNEAGRHITGDTPTTDFEQVDVEHYTSAWQLMDLDGAPLSSDEVPLARAVRYGETSSREFIVRRPSGEDRILLVNAAPVRDAHGAATSAIAVYIDTTEARRNEAALRESHRQLEATLTELRQTQEELVQQERLAAVGQLTAGIAHDFNNILSVIMLRAQMSLATPNLPARLVTDLQNIMQQGQRAAELVQQMLDFGRVAVLQRQPLDLVAFFAEQVALLERTLPEKIRIRLEVAMEHCIVEGDAARLHQMLANLVSNAHDAMRDGGQFTISLEPLPTPAGPEASSPELGAGPWVRITLRDTGTGIAEAVLPNIFEPFFSTKGPGGGTGLGLAQVYGIVKQHCGHISVTTMPGEGTTFAIYLPMHITL